MTQRTLNGNNRQKIELDDKIKKAVAKWRESDYNGVSKVTKRLIEYWFFEDHIYNNRPFEFWHAQKEAIEALIYVCEVCKYDRIDKAIKGFDIKQIPLQNDRWAKYAFKMATGSGKTMVMELAIVWQYFNKHFNTNNGCRYSTHFLVLAPNLIVLDRLREAFDNTREIRSLPFIPPEWYDEFDIQTIIQSERIKEHSEGIIYLTNIQQLYEREERYDNPLDKLLGPKPKKEGDPTASWEYLFDTVTRHDDLLVINDEAHHVHSDDLEWNKTIERINDMLEKRYNTGITMQLDFSATPKDLKGRYFPHIIYDYPLSLAIKDKKVKRPHIGILDNVPPPPEGADFVIKNKAQIDTGIKKFNEYKQMLRGKKPVLFIITDSNKHADAVGEYLIEERGLKPLVIHTDTSGNIKKEDLPRLRKAAKEIDRNEYEVIVSVMMLKEGWDVRNVVVIVPLRALKSEILPEQILGRGLRRMEPFNELWEEKLTVIDHPRFRDLWDAEIKAGELVADITSVEKAKPTIKSIVVDENKLQYYFEVPIVEGGIVRKVLRLSDINLDNFQKTIFDLNKIKIPKIMYTEKDLLTQKIVKEEELAFDYTDDFNIYLTYITKAIARRVKLQSKFNELVPLVDRYITEYLFTTKVDINNKDNIKKLNESRIRQKIVDIFVEKLNKVSYYETPRHITNYFKLSDTPVIHTSKNDDYLYAPKKCIFNLLPADSKYEMDFMEYLDRQDIIAFTKVMREMPIHILYYSHNGYLRYYIPDFIVKYNDNNYYLIETKGEIYAKSYDVKYKDKAAYEWCKSISELTDTKWRYVKIMSNDFYNYQSYSLKDLIDTIGYQRSLD